MAFLKPVKTGESATAYRPLPGGDRAEDQGDRLAEILQTTSVALVFKHSPACFASRRARREVEQVMREQPDLPVYLIDVLALRPLSQWLARRFGITHQSPQVVVFKDGRPVWHASHGSVRAAEIAPKL